MKKFLFLFIYCLCFSDDINKFYEEAQNLENQGNYKEAMLLYKKVAILRIIRAISVVPKKTYPKPVIELMIQGIPHFFAGKKILFS